MVQKHSSPFTSPELTCLLTPLTGCCAPASHSLLVLPNFQAITASSRTTTVPRYKFRCRQYRPYALLTTRCRAGGLSCPALVFYGVCRLVVTRRPGRWTAPHFQLNLKLTKVDAAVHVHRPHTPTTG